MKTELKSLTEVQKGQPFETKGGALQPFASADDFRLAYQMATKLSSSSLVPERYQGSPMDCLLGLDMAFRTNANPLMVLQNLYTVKGSPGWSGQYIIASINRCGRFVEPLHFQFVGTEGQDDWGCFASAITKSGREIKGPTVTIAIAKAEGWYGKNPKWRNIPELMLRYRAGAWFGKTECPEILMGMPAAEELNDIIDVDPDTGEVLGARIVTTSDLGGQETDDVIDTQDAPVIDAKTDDEAVGEIQKEVSDVGYSTIVAEDGSKRWFNVRGDQWDASKHGLSTKTKLPIINQDGSFKAKRVYAKDLEEAQPDPAADDAPNDATPVELPARKGQESAEENTTAEPVGTGNYDLD